ncbi:resolvase domain protein [Peptoclostridium acidaminophilum DSM 3953]|uniref:Resolvase domain protein n=1 Tax=Peptoclostridium acidaminophilum DSM 3953 TaxID=1286171 RepID=W8U8P4_PEPAC|nr:recombinase family protein [Peptoclostridium acidaminophilum]AHM57226.1 resolvase domain protein [Peptoclostridium acidaminophilum DSM 3953]
MQNGVYSRAIRRDESSRGYEMPVLANHTSLARTFTDAEIDASKPKKLRVAAYCRVSTADEMQQHSLENQTIHYTNSIRTNPDYQFAGVFLDRGKTGTSTVNRYGFNKMIRHALEGKIDLILCKSVSRFSRNVVDTLNIVRLLKENGVRVRFEKEGIDTGSMQNAFMLTLLSAVSEDESRNISENLNWSLAKRFERGEPIFVRMLGYTKKGREKWIVVEEEAKIVREAFEECLKGSSAAKIARMFIEKGYKKANGRTDWSSLAVRDILRNERYVGDVLCQKTYTRDYLSHKRLPNEGQRSKYLLRNNHEAIVSREVFEEVQRIVSIGSEKTKRGEKKTYPLSERVICGECGGNLHRYISRGVVRWRCDNRKKSRLLCEMSGVKEEDIVELASKALCEKYQLNKNGNGTHMIIKLMKELQSAAASIDFEQSRLRLDLERALLEESEAVLSLSDMSTPKEKRIAIEKMISEKEKWWRLLEADELYRKEAIEILESLKSKSQPEKELKECLNDIRFLRAWVVRIKAISPILFSIEWVSGDKTQVRKGEN